MEKKNLLGMSIDELKQFASELGEKPFRGKQLFTWISRGVFDFDSMTDLSKAFRQKLHEKAWIGGIEIAGQQRDSHDGTVKFLYRVDNEGNAEFIEGVFMKYRYGNSLCVSSQIGCRMGCRFCASALGGFVRNLTAAEMFGQLMLAESATGESINHIVVMGMGEPFDNYSNLSAFLKLLHAPEGRNMSYRNITVSTSGIIPAIKMFAKDFPQVNLAVSLHRLTDEGRSELMPVNRRYPLDDLLKAARDYTELTGRRISFEYTLIAGENDRDEDVALIVEKLKGMLCHVNLIPLNKVHETAFDSSPRKRAEQIAARLEAAGVLATVRRELGGGIDGACGQLRLRQNEPAGIESE